MHVLIILAGVAQLVAIGAIVMCAIYLGRIAKAVERRQP